MTMIRLEFDSNMFLPLLSTINLSNLSLVSSFSSFEFSEKFGMGFEHVEFFILFQPNVIFLNCGHICTCARCARLLETCPLCRETIVQKCHLFGV